MYIYMYIYSCLESETARNPCFTEIVFIELRFQPHWTLPPRSIEFTGVNYPKKKLPEAK